ncbi:HAD-IC family P-type ATPase, partial [Candidatus Bathyarchaeota archaeon]|nr:HAD-IC family P-type ATPase [Candidatus Bathyarchaeota archaeon]
MKIGTLATEPERSRLGRSEAHILPLDRLVERLRTDVDLGLSQKEVVDRRRLYGLNAIPRIKPSRLRVYATPFRNWLISTYLLISAALAFLAFFFIPEIWKQVAYWLSIISVNAIIAAVQQEKAQTKLESLEDLLAPRSKVLRDGRLIEVSSDELVPGDIVRLAPGDRVPADGRIIEASNFKVDEASLTGESVDVEKTQGEIRFEDCSRLSDIKNAVFLGTYVTTGYARVVITYTGRRTQIGRISTTLREVGGGEILLRDKINRLAKYLALIVAAYLVVSLAYHIVVLYLGNRLFVEGGLNLPLVAAVVGRNLITAMSIMPINIPLLTTIVLVTGVLAMAQHRVIIRDLNAVETLGRVSIVCADKTGTITRDEMTSKWIYLQSSQGKPQLYTITGSGFQSEGRILAVDPRLGLENILGREPEALKLAEVAVKEGTGLELLLLSALLNNEASIIEERVKVGGHEEAVHRALGEATDASLLVMCRKSRVDEGAYRLSYQEFCSYPLESGLRLATKVFRHGEKFVVFTKGATESVLPIADSVWEDGIGGIPVLSDSLRAEINEKAEVFSSCGFRVISFAFKQIDELPSNIGDRASV